MDGCIDFAWRLLAGVHHRIVITAAVVMTVATIAPGSRGGVEQCIRSKPVLRRNVIVRGYHPVGAPEVRVRERSGGGEHVVLEVRKSVDVSFLHRTLEGASATKLVANLIRGLKRKEEGG